MSAFLLLWPTLAFAQDAELRGVIRDQSGAIVPGASVTVLAPTTGARRAITSDAAGRYVFSFLSPGDYDITAELNGFQPVTRTGISLDTGSRITLDLTLRPAQINETVAVATNGPVDESPGDATIIDREFLNNMAIDDRARQSVILLAPGIVGVGPSSDLQFSVDGNRTTSNAVTIDGVSANVAVPRTGGGQQVGATFRQVITGDTDMNASGANAMSLGGFTGGSDAVQLDAIEQVRVQTSAYSAQYGRQPGAQVQLVTRSGSNRFTASGFEYFRSSALDAHDYFSNANPQAQRGPYMQNQFGGVTGGPMLRDRLFYFFSYEGRVMGSPQPARQMRVPAGRPAHRRIRVDAAAAVDGRVSDARRSGVLRLAGTSPGGGAVLRRVAEPAAIELVQREDRPELRTAPAADRPLEPGVVTAAQLLAGAAHDKWQRCPHVDDERALGAARQAAQRAVRELQPECLRQSQRAH